MKRSNKAQILLLAAVLVTGACSNDAITKAKDPVIEKPAETSFDIGSAWNVKKVSITAGQAPPMTYSIEPKPGMKFVALELMLVAEKETEPVSAVFRHIALIDSTGARHDSLFSYPSSLSEYVTNGDSISFNDDSSKLMSGKLRDLGGKAIIVFSVPSDRTGFSAEILGKPAVQLPVQ